MPLQILIPLAIVAAGLTIRWLSVSRREDEQAVARKMAAAAMNKRELGIMSSLSPLAGALARTNEVRELSESPLLRALGQRVEASGLYGKSLDVFIAYQLSAFVGGSILMLVVASGVIESMMYSMLVLFFAALIAMYPISTVNRKYTAATQATSGELPEFIEILQIAMMSGMTARASMKFAADRMDQDTMFVSVVRQLLTDLQVAPQGTESGAYYTAGATIGTSDAKSFFGALAQSDIRGIPVIETLENQASLIREVRTQERHKQSSKLPSKMMGLTWVHSFPMILIAIGLSVYVNIQKSGFFG